MRKKHWLIGLFALMALVIGVGAGTALAQEGGNDEKSPIRGVISRVANILGLDEQQVQDAFDQAQQELRDERFEEMIGQRLADLVESGQITQEQADELREWYTARPDSFWLAGGTQRGKNGFMDRGHTVGGRGFFSAKGQSGAMTGMSEERLTAYLDSLVESEQITQAQADEIRNLHSSRVQGFGRSFERGKGFGRQHDRGHSYQRGFFNFRGYDSGKDKTVPAMPTTVPASATPTTAPAATPTAPADSTDDN